MSSHLTRSYHSSALSLTDSTLPLYYLHICSSLKIDRSSQEKNRSSQEQDPFFVILRGRKTPIPPPSWYHYPIPSTTANQKIPKPRNKFIIYRSHMHAERRYAEHMDHAAGKRGVPERVLCAQIAKDWGGMSEREKQPYNEAAAWEEKLHRLRWPEYKQSEREPKSIETTEMKVKRALLEGIGQSV